MIQFDYLFQMGGENHQLGLKSYPPNGFFWISLFQSACKAFLGNLQLNITSQSQRRGAAATRFTKMAIFPWSLGILPEMS